MENYIQVLIASANKAKEKNNKFGNPDTTVDEVVDYISKLSGREVNNSKNDLNDLISKVEYSDTIRNVTKAFNAMSKLQRKAFVTAQAELISTVLDMRSRKDRSNETMSNEKNTPEQVTYDVVVGDGTYDKRSLQEYLRDALTIMSMDDESKRNKALSKLIENMRFWAKFKGTQAETDRLAGRISEEQKLKEMVLGTLNTLRYGEDVPEVETKPTKKKKQKKTPNLEVLKKEFTSLTDSLADLLSKKLKSGLSKEEQTTFDKGTKRRDKLAKAIKKLETTKKKPVKKPVKKPTKKVEDKTLKEIVSEGKKSNIIPKIISDKLTALYEQVKGITYGKEEGSKNFFDPTASILAQNVEDIPLREEMILDEIDKQDNPSAESDKEYVEKAAIFAQRMKDVVSNIYNTGFVIDAGFVLNTPELAYLAKKSKDGKSLPAEVADILLRAAIKAVSSNTSGLAGETTYDPDIGKHTLRY